jgi:hypothetical protein
MKPGIYTPEEAAAAIEADAQEIADEYRALKERVAVLEAEVARLSQPETDADLIKRIERVWPDLQRRQMSAAAMTWQLPGQRP